MEIGVVNMYNTLYKCRYLINCLESLGFKIVLLDGFHNPETYIYDCVKRSSITHWVFSGSDTAVTEVSSPQLSLELLKLPKKLMFICYAMESIIIRLGNPIRKRRVNKKELFPLKLGGKLIHVRRNHRWYFDTVATVLPLAWYNGELMMASYKNAIFIQFHPEKSPDGKELIMDWVRG
jgi:GMP synthase-like glutamine amidotransferase